MLYFKLPDNDAFFTVDNTSEINVSFVSFDKKKNIDFKGNIEEISPAEIIEKAVNPKSKSNLSELGKETQESYAVKIKQAQDFIEKK